MSAVNKIKIKAKYANTKKTFTTTGLSKSDWTDEKLFGLEGYKIETYDQKTMAVHCTNILGKLITGVSERDICYILTIAWNLLAPGTTWKRIFPSTSVCESLTQKDITTASNKTIASTNASITHTSPQGEREIGQVGGYVCATLLRLFTKSEENYRNAFDAIKASYANFYEEAFPLSPYVIPERNIKSIKLMFNNRPMYKSLLAPILYHLSDAKAYDGLLNATFAMHLKSTGLHCWHMFKTIAAETNRTTDILLTVLHIRDTEAGLDVIDELIRNFEADETILKAAKRERMTYEYARIFDKQMFASLQTKSCKSLTITLANLLSMITTAGAGNVKEIAAIKSLDQHTHETYEKFAKGIYDYLYKSEDAAAENEVFAAAML